MKRAIQLVLMFSGLVVSSGCVTSYWIDRGRDAADIVTVTVGIGAGAKARVGPLAPGLLVCHDLAGLRGGRCFLGNDNPFETDVAAPFPVSSPADGLSFGSDVFCLESFSQPTERPKESPLAKRNKDIQISSPVPWIGVGKHMSDYTQLEAVVAIGASLRVGFNPGELLDFLLGWTTLDIFNDDIERKKKHEVTSEDE